MLSFHVEPAPQVTLATVALGTQCCPPPRHLHRWPQVGTLSRRACGSLLNCFMRREPCRDELELERRVGGLCLEPGADGLLQSHTQKHLGWGGGPCRVLRVLHTSGAMR